MQAMIILGLFDYDALQVCLSLLLNLFYTCLLAALNPIEDPTEQRYELQNECVLLITLQLMMLFVG